MRGRISFVLILVVLCFSGSYGALNWDSAGRVDAQEKAAQEKLTELRKGKLNIARATYDVVADPINGFAHGVVHTWSVRVLKAELELAMDKSARVDAHKAHVSRISKLVKSAQFGGNEEKLSARFYESEARIWQEEATEAKR